MRIKPQKQAVYMNSMKFIFLFVFAFCQKATAEENNYLLINIPFVEMHSGPGRGYPVINVIEQGERVEVLIKRTSWLKVEDKRGIQGWFNETALNSVSQNGEKVSFIELTENDYQQRTWEASVMYGDLNGASYYNLGLGFVFSPVITTEFSLGKSQGDVSNNDIYELMIIGEPMPDLVVSPYIGVGAGIINTEPHSILADAKIRENTLISSAIGAKYYLTRNFVLKAEYKYSLVLTDLDDNEEIKLWKLGFSVFF